MTSQSAEVEEAVRLLRQINKLSEEGRDSEAIPLAERVLTIIERAFGPDHLHVAGALSKLGLLYDKKGDYARAEPLLQRALAIEEKALGPDHPDFATSLNNLAGLYFDKGDYARAEPLFRQALEINEKAFGRDHPDVALSLQNLALLYKEKGNYAEAEPLYRRALTIREKALGANHPDVAKSLNNLATLYLAKGEYEQAEPLLRRALAINEKALGADHPGLVASISNLAELYKAKADYEQAEPLLRRALSIDEKVLGSDHPEVATSINNLAGLYYEMGDYARAAPLLQRALSIKEKTFGPDHPSVAVSLNNLASMYFEKGDYSRAEMLFRRALSIKEKVLGPDHEGVATSINNLAALYNAKGDYVRAELLLQRALAISEKTFGPDHASVALALNNLAAMYYDMGDYTRAEPLYQRSLSVREKVFGPSHPEAAASLNNLAELYKAKGDYARAEPLLKRSLAVAEKALGLHHPNVAPTLNNLAVLYQDKGDYVRAESLFRRSLEIREQALGLDHPEVVASLGNLSAVYQAQGDYARAMQLLSRRQEIQEHNLSLILATGSERQKLAYLFTLVGSTYSNVSLHTRSAPADAQALQLSLTAILRYKGRALDAMTEQVASLRRRLGPEDRTLLDQLSVTQTRLSTLVLGGHSNSSLDEHRSAVSRLEEKAEQLQDAISRRSAEFKVQTQPATVGQVQQALPSGSALVEFFSYQPFDAKAKSQSERFGPARYVAYVLRAKGEPLWADLGETKNIEADVSRLQVALRCPQTVDDIKDCPAVTEVKRLARMLDDRVMRPVRKLLGQTRQVFISPDAALNLIPFGALVDEGGGYLLESYSFTYLTSGRDLLRLQLSAESQEPPLIVANPAFGKARQPSTAVSEPEAAPLPLQRSTDMLVDFDPLPGTAAEAKVLAAVMPDARVLTQAQATEAALKRVSSPRVLHIATHGFFLADQPGEAAEGTRGPGFAVDSVSPRVLARSENPLLRSGLALAGANSSSAAGNEDDGILTALETANLNLWGTKLVVLSACETGVGQVRNGEGVYGLRRALVLAGSESQVMSLWQVSDKATRDLMVGYYKRLLAGEGRTEALRQVQLEMLHSGKRATDPRAARLGPGAAIEADYSHPYYWAGFIQSGDWRKVSTLPGHPQR